KAEVAVARHQLDVIAAGEMVERRGRRLADQALEADLVGRIVQAADRIVEQDRKPPALLRLALHEDQAAGLRRLLPVDAPRVVAMAELAQGIEAVSGAGAAARLVARVLHFFG